MEAKEYISADHLVRDSFLLAKDVYESGFIPEVLVCLWRGGTPVGIVVHEYLLFKGIKTNHIAIKAESYIGIKERGNVDVENVDAFVSGLPSDSRVLIVDDIFDTGYTLAKVCEQFARRTKQVRTATLYFKQRSHADGLAPDYFLRETNRWVVFPHEIVGLTAEEIKCKDPELAQVLGE